SFSFTAPPPPAISTLSLHDALPICLLRFVKLGGFPIYREKDQAGLKVYDRTGGQIYGAHFPERAYSDFQNIPDLVVRSLLFVERSEEHTSELQSLAYLVCRLLLEKK